MDGRTMPLLESLLAECERAEDTVVVHINHCMENSFYFTRQLRRVFHEVVLIAVPYNDRGVPETAEYPVYHGARTAGGYRLLRGGVFLEDTAADFPAAVRRLIALALQNDVQPYVAQGKRVLILEDGGYHYPVLEEFLRQPRWRAAVLGAVEQTTAGTRASCRDTLAYPVASVARSAYKTRVEAYFVANRVVDELTRMLHALDEFIDFHDVLLLGYGVIGRSVAGSLRPHHVRLFARDTDADVQQTAQAEGCLPWDGVFREGMLVLGNVGKPSFSADMLCAFLAGPARRIYLASSSSKQEEFKEIFGPLQKARRLRYPQADCYRFPSGKELLLLAEGFPLNFYDRGADSLTYDMIDPVFSEMLLSALYLREHQAQLPSRTYLFGIDEQLGGAPAEQTLLTRWMTLNHLHFDAETFNRHPQEDRLRQNVIYRRSQSGRMEQT